MACTDNVMPVIRQRSELVVLCEPVPFVMTCWLSEPEEQAHGHLVGACNDRLIAEKQVFRRRHAVVAGAWSVYDHAL